MWDVGTLRPGRVVLLGTPIGDPGDASPRVRELLATADVLAAEDTRRLWALCRRLGIEPRGRIVRVDEHTERERVEQLLAAARDGAVVAVVTDAGMPTVSDPGFVLVRAAAAAGIAVTAAPGPSAPVTALALSGLPTDRWCFEGFLPRRPGELARTLTALAPEPRTLVFFESPRRLAATLRAMAEPTAFGPDRPAAVCRELTKTYEEIVREPLGALADWAAAREILGEITLVVGGAPPAALAAGPDALAAEVADAVAAGSDRTEALGSVAARHGVPRRTVYDAVVAARRPREPTA
jgi:16S rRNA (cytidine1402-2'-O)-methyltransferase